MGTGGHKFKICGDGWDGCNFCPHAGLYMIDKCYRLWWLFHRCKQLQYVNIEGCCLLKGKVTGFC